jgi:hypothetical protein
MLDGDVFDSDERRLRLKRFARVLAYAMAHPWIYSDALERAAAGAVGGKIFFDIIN